MPIRFSTEAANADRLVDDSDAGVSSATPKAVGSDSRLRDPLVRTDRMDSGRDEKSDTRGDAKPGKDINAAGFVKDKDAGKP